VKVITNRAFAAEGSIKSAKISSSVQEIGESAFIWCTRLESLTLMEGLQIIGYEAFKGCRSLLSVTIPQSVKVIGAGAFEGCERLEISLYYLHNPSLQRKFRGFGFNYINLLDKDQNVIGRLYNLDTKHGEPYTNFLTQLMSGAVEHLSEYDVLFSASNRSFIKKGKAALCRLLFPLELEQSYMEVYQAYLHKFGHFLIPYLIRAEDIASINILSELGAIKKQKIHNYIDQAAQTRNIDLLNFFINYKTETFGKIQPTKLLSTDDPISDIWLTHQSD